MVLLSRVTTFLAALVITFAALTAPQVLGQTRLTTGEANASRAFEAARKLGSTKLYAYLKNMPKGGDLHMHIDGAVYAETFLAEAVKQGLFTDPVAMRIVQPVSGTYPS